MSESKLPPTIRIELETIKNYLKAARDVMQSGYMPDITALSGRVAALCEKIQKAPEEIHAACLPELQKVLEQINECDKDMRAYEATRLKGNA